MSSCLILYWISLNMRKTILEIITDHYPFPRDLEPLNNFCRFLLVTASSRKETDAFDLLLNAFDLLNDLFHI